MNHSVETGRWYDGRLEVRDRTVKAYLDGKLLQERTLPRVDTVLAIAGRDERAGEIVLKVVNSSDTAADVKVNVAGVSGLAPQATVTVLTSTAPTDENTFEEPAKIVPKDVDDCRAVASVHAHLPAVLDVDRPAEVTLNATTVRLLRAFVSATGEPSALAAERRREYARSRETSDRSRSCADCLPLALPSSSRVLLPRRSPPFVPDG